VKEIWVDKNKCLHCLSCVLSCAAAHSTGGSLENAVNEVPGPKPRLFTVHDEDRPFVLMCRQCENSPCVEACMAAAITRDSASGVVNIDNDRCVGCWMCIMVCPFGVIGRDGERRLSLKCDRCPGRDKPACVEACPTGALIWGESKEQEYVKRERYIARITGPERGQANEICSYR